VRHFCSVDVGSSPQVSFFSLVHTASTYSQNASPNQQPTTTTTNNSIFLLSEEQPIRETNNRTQFKQSLLKEATPKKLFDIHHPCINNFSKQKHILVETLYFTRIPLYF
jgi:hypothetical protein